MQIDITRLKSGMDDFIELEQSISFPKEELEKVDLLDLQEVTVIGKMTKDYLGNYVLEATISGTMILPCALTLKPVPYPFTTEVTGNIEGLLEEINEIDKKTENTIDILPIIWENILMEIPMKVVSDEAKDLKLEGDGWKLITEQTKGEVNPELQKLEDLFK